jgi:NAD(P)-dependent dehydrogenase (short-subunit alcohol dehydrogenase family)
MNLKLLGKRALVTGASAGIGVAIAEALAREGARVLVHGRDTVRTDAVVGRIVSAGGKAMPITGTWLRTMERQQSLRKPRGLSAGSIS